MRVLRLSAIALSFFVVAGCADPPAEWPEPQLTETGPEAYRSSKADLPWTDGQGLTAEWRDTLICATSLSQGAVDGAYRFFVGLWNLPGLIGDLVSRIGQEVIRRTADAFMAMSDEEALARVRATLDEDKRRLMALIATVRRAVPEIWIALQEDTGWFSQLEREEKVELVCEVTGRIAFEVLIVIAGDKGLSKLLALGRVRLVHGVQSHAMRFATVARLAQLAKRAVVDVGGRIAGERRLRWADPESRFGPLASPERYREIVANGGGHDGEPLPAFAQWEEETETLTLLVHLPDWEDVPGYGYFDILLPSSAIPPAGALIREGDLSFELVSDMLLAIEPDNRAWGFGALSALSEDETYTRYIVPADLKTVSQVSLVFEAIEARFRFLADLVGPGLRPSIESIGEFIDLSPREQVDYLDRLIEQLDD